MQMRKYFHNLLFIYAVRLDERNAIIIFKIGGDDKGVIDKNVLA